MQVVGGGVSKHAALQRVVEGLEARRGGRSGLVTLADFVSYAAPPLHLHNSTPALSTHPRVVSVGCRHYEDVSATIGSDDYFGAMVGAISPDLP